MAAPRGLVQWLDQELHKNMLLPRGARLLLAVSGGADSVALLRLLAEVNGSDYWNWTLAVGHVDHGIRGAASARDAEFVRELAKTLKVPVSVRELKLKPDASEETARKGRLAALLAMARRRGSDMVVMAHHAEDQAETLVMRMMRGCGLHGLGSMATKVEVEELTIVRPLLGIRRETLREYLRYMGQSWREDATNASPDYLRNRVRAEWMPMMTAMWPNAIDSLGKLAQLAREADEVIVAQARGLAKAGEKGQWPRKLLKGEPPIVVGEMLRREIEAIGGSREIADFERIRHAVRLIQGESGGQTIEMGRGVVVQLRGPVVIVLKRRGTERRPVAENAG